MVIYFKNLYRFTTVFLQIKYNDTNEETFVLIFFYFYNSYLPKVQNMSNFLFFFFLTKNKQSNKLFIGELQSRNEFF